MNRWIDLHLHSTASDGQHRPADLMRLAQQRGLSVVALTDHDTVDGLAEATVVSTTLGLEFVPGIELAAEHARGTLHILGYGIDGTSDVLSSGLVDLRRWRDERNAEIVRRLAGMGVNLDYAAMKAAAPAGIVGRPHIARALVTGGWVRDYLEVFRKYIGRGAPAYVRRRMLTPQEAIRLIRESGGVAALAHPSLAGCTSRLELQTLVSRLRDYGLEAIEVHHPDHTVEQTRWYVELAARCRLLMTGGSDLHQIDQPPRNRVGFHGIRVPYALWEQMRHRCVAFSGSA